MSRITQKSAVAPLNPWANISTGVANQANSASPASGTQPSTGVGQFQPGFGTMIGQKFDTSDGRELALVANGGVALAAGTLIQSPAEITTAEHLAVTVPTAYPATAGTYQILVTNSSTVKSVNQFAGGYLIVDTTPDLGSMYKIASHQAAANGATFVVTLEDPIQTTLTASSYVSLFYNPYGGISASAAGTVSAGVIVTPTSSPTGGAIGVSLYQISASTVPAYNTTTGAQTTNGVIQYGLIVTHGPASCLIDTVTTVGYPLGASTAVAGALAVSTLTKSAQAGILMQTATSGRSALVYLQL